MDKKELQSKQIKATSELCIEFERDCDSQKEKIDTLRSMLRMKETAARKLYAIFETRIMPLRRFGISDISVLGIAEALENELITNLGEMEVIADRLAIATHNNDIRDAYGSISAKLIDDVKDILESMRETREEALNDNDSLQRVEWCDTWESLNNETKNLIS